MGISYETASKLSKSKLEDLTGDPGEEVPRLKALRPKNPEEWQEPPYPEDPAPREPEFYTITRDKWIEVETAFDAANTIHKKLQQKDESGLVFAGVTKTNKGQHERYAVSVNISSRVPLDSFQNDAPSIEESENIDGAVTPDITMDELKTEVPDQVTGTVGGETYAKAAVDNIPVEFDQGVEYFEECSDEECGYVDGYHYDEKYRLEDRWNTGVPIGSILRVERNGEEYSGTLGPRVSDDGSSKALATAHQFLDEGESDSEGVGRTGRQPDEGNGIGEAEVIYYEDPGTCDGWDVSLINPSGSKEFRRELVSDSGGTDGTLETEPVSGRVGFDNLKDEFSSVCRQGIRTGRCSGDINTLLDCDGARNIQVRRDFSTEGGNSGGPWFVEDGDELLVAGVHRAGYTDRYGFEYARGMWIGDLEEKLDVEVY